MKSPASGAGNVRWRSRVRVDLCVSVGVPVFVCLRSSCYHVTEVGGL